MTAKNSHIVREFDTPTENVAAQVPTRPAKAADGTVLVEDSITHQAGDGITTGMSPTMETPDIFDNTAQAAVKPQTANQALNDAAEVPVDTKNTVPVSNNQEARQDQTIEQTNNLTSGLHTLPDGSVDISRDQS